MNTTAIYRPIQNLGKLVVLQSACGLISPTATRFGKVSGGMLKGPDKPAVIGQPASPRKAAVRAYPAKTNQEDCLGFYLSPDENILALALGDGLGGHTGGALASKTAVTTFLEEIANGSQSIDAIITANHAVVALKNGDPLNESNFMSTFVAVVFRRTTVNDGKFIRSIEFFKVGDSRNIGIGSTTLYYIGGDQNLYGKK